MTRRIIQQAFGEPEVLELTETEPLTGSDLAEGEVVVDVLTAGVNPIDVMTRTGGGMAATGAVSLPFTPGWDPAGTVAALGAHVTALASAGKHEWLRSLGADETVGYHDDDAVGALAGTVDTALSLAPGSREAALRAVRRAGDVVALGLGATDLQPEAEEAGVRLSSTHVHTQREWLEAVVDLAERGAITPLVSRTLDLDDAADAHRAVEGGHSTGKIVLTTAR